MVRKDKTRHSSLRVLAFSLAILFTLFAAQALIHSHENGQNEATCQVCQAAHIGSVPASVTLAFFALLLVSGYVRPFVLAFHQELFFHDSPSRAPPIA